MNSKQYYIVSVKHTSKADTALTLWGPNNAGYVYDKSMAGIYTQEQADKFKNDDDNIPVDKDKADVLFLPARDFNDQFIALPNDTTVRTILSIPTKNMKHARYKMCKMVFHLPETQSEQGGGEG